MADTMSKNTVETLAAGAPWEKSGNTSWAQCNACKSWFHVGPALLAKADVKLHCPQCHHEFLAADAARIIKAG
jgi:predicted Zn finger-like uncharacterized protein